MNNTVLGNYPVPNPIPESYLAQQDVKPTLILVGASILDRLNSFGMEIDDIVDADKMFSIFTPREFNTFYNVCDFSSLGFSSLNNILGNDFLTFNRYTVIGEKQQRPTEVSKQYIDMLHYTPMESLSPVEVVSFQLGYSIDKVPEQLDLTLKQIAPNLFAGIIQEAEPKSRERYVYDVCNNVCDKLYDIYGSRMVAKTRVFSELVRLSQLSALNRNS